jgi:predicted AAA+ superfamily ATPase
MADSIQLMNILKDQKDRMMRLISNDKIIKRELPFDINSLTLGAAAIILGPRRCGKSTFSFEILKNIKFGYVNFDDERLNISSENLNDVLEAIYSIEGDVDIILFDEIQEVTGWEKFISRLIDEKKIMMIGSNSRLSDRDLAKHITGRHINYNLLPFSFMEFLHYFEFETEKNNVYSTNKKAELIHLLNKYIDLGGFPLALKIGRDYLMDFYNDIIERDIIQAYNIKLKPKLKELSRYIINNYSSEISYKKLGNILNISGNSTINNWISYFTDSYIFFVVERFSFKLKESIIAPKKVYVIDNGLININVFDRNIGRLIENTVAVDLLKCKNYSHNNFEINYWKGYNNKEIDFVLHMGMKVLKLINVTFSSSMEDIKEREINSLISGSNELNCDDLNIVTWDFESIKNYNGKPIKFIPLWKWLMEDIKIFN